MPSLHFETRRFKYAAVYKSLERLVTDLRIWHEDFDPTWFMVLKIKDGAVDRLLRKLSQSVATSTSTTVLDPITLARHTRRALGSGPGSKSREAHLPLIQTTSASNTLRSSKSVDWSSLRRLPLSDCSIVTRVATSTEKRELLLLDPWRKSQSRLDTAEMAVQNTSVLVARLSAADLVQFGLLQCKGLVERPQDGQYGDKPRSRYDLVFKLPSKAGSAPIRSLRHLFIKEWQAVSLTHIFGLASQLARAVSFVHLFGFVHKAIRPENIVLFRDMTSPAADNRQSCVLVGFDLIRGTTDTSDGVGDRAWHEDLYQHPLRQGTGPLPRFELRHDVYSLGVVLLEIGVGQTFLMARSDDGDNFAPSPILARGLCDDYEDGATMMRNPMRVKSHLLHLTATVLRERMGDRYSDVVRTCLTCLDEDNDFEDLDAGQDRDGIAEGLNYVEKVVMKLGEIVV